AAARSAEIRTTDNRPGRHLRLLLFEPASASAASSLSSLTSGSTRTTGSAARCRFGSRRCNGSRLHGRQVESVVLAAQRVGETLAAFLPSRIDRARHEGAALKLLAHLRELVKTRHRAEA